MIGVGSGGGNRTPRRLAYETKLEPLQSTPQCNVPDEGFEPPYAACKTAAKPTQLIEYIFKYLHFDF